MPQVTAPASPAIARPGQKSIEQEIACVERELVMRRTNYPKWVEAKRMKQEDADEQIDTMQSVLGRLKAIKYLFNI